MTRRTLSRLWLALAVAASLGACTLVHGEDRVWRPGDPDPNHERVYAPSYAQPTFTPSDN